MSSASSVPGWLSPVLSAAWPVSNTLALALGVRPAAASPAASTSAAGADARFGAGHPIAPLSTHVALQAGGVPRLVLAALCWSSLAALPRSTLASLSLAWILPLVLRDLAVVIAVAGGWDALLYSRWSPLRSRAAALKFNPAYPRDAQFVHDIAWALCSTLISAAAEVALLHAWARGVLPGGAPLPLPAAWWRDGATLAWVLSMPYVRIAHFYCIHRMMHVWGTTTVPDLGAWLYKHVHSLHHLSRNPTSWSGISMHPVVRARAAAAAARRRRGASR